MTTRPTYEELQQRVKELEKEAIERKGIEGALLASEEQYRTLFETMDQGAVYQDADGKIISANLAAEKILGLSLDQMQGRTSIDPQWKSIHEDGSDFPGETHPSMVALKSGEKVKDTIMGVFNPKKEEHKWIKINAVPQFRIGEEKPYQVYTTFDDITEIRHSQRALEESEKKYRHLVESTNDWVWSCDTNGIHTFSNTAAKTLLGYEPQEIVGKSAFDLIHPEDQDRIQNMFQEAVCQKKGWQEYSIRWLYKDGSIRFIESRAEPMLDDEGHLVGFSGIDRDITERKQIEEALLESEKRYRNLFELSPDGIVIWQDEKAALVNPAAMRMFGATSADEIIGKSNYEIIPVDYHNKLRARLQNIHETGRIVASTEYKFIRLDDRIIDVESTGTLINYKNHTAVLSLYRDISKRKQAEDAIRESQERFRELAELLPETIYEMDATGNLTFVNRKAFEQFGYTQQDLDSGINCLNMIVPDDRRRAMENISKILEGENIGLQEYSALEKDGTTFPALFRSDAIIRKGKAEGLRGFIIDITEKKRLEAQVQQAQKMEAIGTLAGGIAHDFNNILSPLLGYAEMLKYDLSVDSPLQASVDEIIRASLRARDLVQQILAFSRQTEDELKPIKLQPVIKEAMSLLRSSLPKTINIIQNIDSTCGAVVAVPTQIHQIVMNLSTNAFHAMEDSGGTLKVTLKQVRLEPEQSELIEVVPGTYACLTVSDTGVGIEKDIFDKIFDPYFTTKEKNKGTGLGLSAVHGIVKSCDGDIHIYSEPGKGTEVHVYLPIIESKIEEKANEAIESIQGGTEKILLVDDEEAIVRMEQQMLERLGYEVTTRTGSVDALEAFKARPDRYDLIITDMTMPNMTGIRLAREMKKIRPKIPIIICTGFSDQINEEKCNVMGFQGYVMKPIVRREIADTIREVLDKSEKPDE